MNALLNLRSLQSVLRITNFGELSGFSIQGCKRSNHKSPYEREMEISDKESSYEDQPFLSRLFVEDDGKLPFSVRFQKIFKRKKGFSQYLDEKYRTAQLKEQTLDVERLKFSGWDLNAAHFVLFRKGGVKFQNIDRWIYYDDKAAEELPLQYEAEYTITGIDISNLNLRPPALTYLENLSSLTHLSIANSPRADDWWLDFISGAIPSLQHLDISGCSKITYRGISILYRLSRLESLNVSRLRHSKFLEMTLLELEGLLPKLKIYGLDCVKGEKHNQSGSDASC